MTFLKPTFDKASASSFLKPEQKPMSRMGKPEHEEVHQTPRQASTPNNKSLEKKTVSSNDNVFPSTKTNPLSLGSLGGI